MFYHTNVHVHVLLSHKHTPPRATSHQAVKLLLQEEEEEEEEEEGAPLPPTLRTPCSGPSGPGVAVAAAPPSCSRATSSCLHSPTLTPWLLALWTHSIYIRCVRGVMSVGGNFVKTMDYSPWFSATN